MIIKRKNEKKNGEELVTQKECFIESKGAE